MNNIFRSFSAFAKKYKLLHMAFWIWSYMYLLHIKLVHYNPGLPSYIDTTIIKVFQVLCVYTVMLYLLPRYFYKKRYLLFLLFTFIVIVATTALTIFFENLEVYLRLGGNIRNIPILIVSTFTDNIIHTGFFFAIYIISDKYYTEKRNNRLEKIQLESELRFLKSQIHPHFLFNALNSIYVLMNEDKKLAGDTLLKFSDLLRHQLYYCNNKEAILLEKEISFLKDYIAIEAIRNEKINVTFEVDNNNKEALIAPFILTSFVENAFKHVSNHKTDNLIAISISVVERKLNFLICNSYNFRIESTEEKLDRGVGLQNARRRLQLLYENKHKLVITNGSEVFSVKLELQLNEN